MEMRVSQHKHFWIKYFKFLVELLQLKIKRNFKLKPFDLTTTKQCCECKPTYAHKVPQNKKAWYLGGWKYFMTKKTQKKQNVLMHTIVYLCIVCATIKITQMLYFIIRCDIDDTETRSEHKRTFFKIKC